MRLAAAFLLLVAPLAQAGDWPQDSRIRDLIERLLNERIGDREKAAEELTDLGAAAVPALEGLRSSPDPELRSRATAILKSILENTVVGRHWRRGPSITLDFESAPVARILEELARQGRDAFKFDPAGFQDLVSLKVKEATFWDALDALCRAVPALTWEVAGNVLTFTKKHRPAFPNKRQGEFMVWLDEIRFTREYEFTGNPRSMFILDLASAWEAGVHPVAVEQRVTEVLDESGTNLWVPDAVPYGAWLDIPRVRLQREGVFVPLALGAKEVRTFTRVKGASTFFFPKSYQDVSIDLRATPAPAMLDGMTVSVRNFRPLKGICTLEVIVSSTTGPKEPPIDRLPPGEIALVDDQGGLHRARSSTRGHATSDTSTMITENLEVPLPEARTAVSLNLRVLKEVMEKRVAFEFNDIAVE